jgi:hypothetical protein
VLSGGSPALPLAPAAASRERPPAATLRLVLVYEVASEACDRRAQQHESPSARPQVVSSFAATAVTRPRYASGEVSRGCAPPVRRAVSGTDDLAFSRAGGNSPLRHRLPRLLPAQRCPAARLVVSGSSDFHGCTASVSRDIMTLSVSELPHLVQRNFRSFSGTPPRPLQMIDCRLAGA